MQNIDYKRINQLAKKGKELDPILIRIKAIKLLGKGHCSILAGELQTSRVTINKALTGSAPLKLLQIRDHLDIIESHEL